MSLVPSAVSGTISDVIPSLTNIPPIDYTSRDYASLVNDLVNLIPTYLPEWTDRSPGDFGIVLIELFAYMGDILNFYSDRVANESYLATAQQRQSVLNIASLLDYTPYGNSSALVSLLFSVTPPSPTVLIPAGTQVQANLTASGATTFQTTQDAYIWGDFTPTVQTTTGTNLAGQQVVLNQGPYVYTGGASNQTVTVGGVTWTLAPGNTLAGQGATATMFTVVGSPVPNTIQFGDGVHGAKPGSGVAISVTYQPAVTGTVYSVSTPAQHGSSVTGETIGTSTGLASQVYSLFQTPVVDGSVVIIIDEGNGPLAWTYYQRLVDALYTDMAYTLSTDANGVVSATFGDGINGRIPIPGSVVTASYLVGGGSSGNVSANTLTNLVNVIPNVANAITVTNPAAAYGGADAETLDHIRIHAPLSITAINRAVTLDDYAALVLNNPSVAKAAATSTAYNTVNIYIHPAGDFIAQPAGASSNTALNTAVANLTPSITNSAMTGYLDDKKMVGTSIQILPPQYNKLTVLQVGYVPVDVTVAIQVLPQYNQATVQANVVAAIYNLMLFSLVDFGYRITLSSVYHTVQAVEGVDYCQVSVLSRHENTPLGVGDIVCAVYEIPQANNVIVTATGGI